jgi:hypothetical protein
MMTQNDIPYIHLENVFDQLTDILSERIAGEHPPEEIIETLLKHLLSTTPEMVEAAYRHEGSPLGAYRAVLSEVLEQRHKTSWHPV